jgi:hypothetical protein
MGLLDKDNPCEDFYENKHLNSDLICCNFTELSDEEFYESLRWANQTLMKNYYDRQRDSTLKQINYLYKEKDVTFRGFRHRAGIGQLGADVDVKAKATKKLNIDELVNWESSQTGDAERFSQDGNQTSANKLTGEECFENYLRKKEIRLAAKKAANASNKAASKDIKVENYFKIS